jgi:hypothetical protein
MGDIKALPPFVVEVPYSTAPRMVRYQGPLIDLPARADYLDAKRVELATLGHSLSGHIAHHDLAPLIQHAAHALKLANPDQIQSIEDLALCLEEDVALMQDGVLSAICFCFPSSWVPTERIGMPLGKIHEHVADGQKLVAASPKIAHVMSDLEQGSFRRYVWTITNSPKLSQHPSHKNPNIPITIEDLYYRVETQTTLPLPSTTGRSSLFLVKVEVCPLSHLWSNLEQRQTLYDSIFSMSEAVLEYKNLQTIKTILMDSYRKAG